MVNTYRIEPGALFRPEHKVVTLQEIMRNQEDAYNLQMTQEAGILMGPLTQPSIRMRTGHSPSTPREALETSPLTAPV
jgi:hypothetical protein